eukprot:5543573-Amphidinium_carterae.1
MDCFSVPFAPRHKFKQNARHSRKPTIKSPSQMGNAILVERGPLDDILPHGILSCLGEEDLADASRCAHSCCCTDLKACT